ncbi:MAG: DUF1501 domain-containing protein [Verrucomicrobiota bacterium]
MAKDLRHISRRQFLAAGTCGAMTIGPLVNTLAQLSLVNSAVANTSGEGLDMEDDFKALVCIFLRGGCDMNNVLIPRSNSEFLAEYAQKRGVVGIPNGYVPGSSDGYDQALDDTLILSDPSNTNSNYNLGLHPNMPNLNSLFNDGTAAFVTNVGTLAFPTDPQNYGSVSLPKQLFSHSDQQTQWMSSISDRPYVSGWGARVAELYYDSWNTLSNTSMLITAGGNNRLMSGSKKSPQYAVSTNGAISLAGFGDNYSDALQANGTYKNTREGRRLQALENIMQFSHAHLIEDTYANTVARARGSEGTIQDALGVEDALGVDFDNIFNQFGANNELGNELKVIARLIAGRRETGNVRQMFFVDLGGFDAHQSVNIDLPILLDQVDRAIGEFNATLKEIDAKEAEQRSDKSIGDLYNRVLTFEASDFNRTWTPNGNNFETAGTDHGWGTHCFVVGGPVDGGKFYGQFPDLIVGGNNDVPNRGRGRWIPTTSVDQYAAMLAKWFGVPENSTEMATIFPNLYRFDSPFSESSSIQFIKPQFFDQV